MALGEYGTTLLDELNRLANGGTYRAPGEMVGEALAAKQWATSLSVTTNLTDTVGVLNAIAGTTNSNRLDYNGVCNAIAGTFQLPAAQALRAIAGEATAPGKPTGVIAVAVGSGEVNVSYTAPANDGGESISQYYIYANPATISPTMALGTSSNVYGLTNGTSYTFTVAAENIIGLGLQSDPSNSVTPVAP